MKRTNENNQQPAGKSRRVDSSIDGVLPVLPTVKIDMPCPKNWDEMDGGAARRYCGHCQKHVFNLEATAPQDASDLLLRVQDGENLCMRIRKDAAGRIVTRQEAGPPMARRTWLQSVVKAVAGVWGVALLSGCGYEQGEPMVGAVAPGEACVELGEACPEQLPEAEARMGDVMMAPEQQHGNEAGSSAGQEKSPQPLMGKPTLP